MIAHLVFGLLHIVGLTSAVTQADIQSYLKDHLSSNSEVLLPSDPSYETELTERWNAYKAPTYVVGVKPATVEDVSIIIRYASTNSIPFMGTGGGHGYTVTTSALENGINIDLSAFDGVSINTAASTMTIGGAVTFKDVLDPVHAAGKEIQTGSCSCVGMVGATLGGGIGVYQGLHGLIIDALESVTIVTGKGDIVNASLVENSDLFWGIRGAGQNFGIVTSATYNLHDQTNGGNALNGDFLFPLGENSTIFNILKSFAGNQPDALSLTSAIQYSSSFGTVVIMVNAVYVGTEEDGRKLLQPLLSTKHLESNVTMIPYNRLILENRFGADPLGCIAGLNQAAYGLNLYHYDVATYQATLAAYVDFYAATGLTTSYMVTEMFPTKVTLETPDDMTAYPYRGTMAYLFFSFSGFTTNAQISAIAAFAEDRRAAFAKLNSAKGLQVYVNYAHGDEGRNAWYTAEKLPSLEYLKGQWDPQNLFNFTNGLTY
ncbi:FAD binding domain-containing protein [Didymella exigua CBS 183.55]|uniref:FAD binding domain-containing protein n=1 Tax=Didymella exigua CBS 183.55 TaxID=1150837 RepID=A0A6A5R8T6_9PLEO|nr:FAD binding domain-containing protein [Didymella exigua CBS 183.55]KAF1923394.1 FAD binding domain-containing protein [Didymella exigua CBS 183.55]